MKKYRADLHIHTVLSPCADWDMTPGNIISRAREFDIKILGITDHNSTKNALLVKRLAQEMGIFVLTGAEITTKEEVHCLVFLEEEDQLQILQDFINKNLTKVPNPDGHFGYQPVIDENEQILEIIPYFLPAALKVGINEIQRFTHDLNGIFIPAHIDRHSGGIFSQLGIIPENLRYDALGITRFNKANDVRKQYLIENSTTLISNSDAHYLSQIGQCFSFFHIEKPGFNEIKMALNQQDRRFVEVHKNNF
jgi:PHP family Zn ribbon phosphoesterase